MKCVSCGHENPEENKFCSVCGNPLSKATEPPLVTVAKPPVEHIVHPVHLEGPSEAGPVESAGMSKRNKYILIGAIAAAIVIIAAVLVVVLVVLKGGNPEAENAYMKKMDGIRSEYSVALTEIGETSTEAGHELQKATGMNEQDAINLANRVSDTYIPEYKDYKEEITSIYDNAKKLDPPSKYGKAHELFLKSCDSTKRTLDELISGFELYHNPTAEKVAEGNRKLVRGKELMTEAVRYRRESNSAYGD